MGGDEEEGGVEVGWVREGGSKMMIAEIVIHESLYEQASAGYVVLHEEVVAVHNTTGQCVRYSCTPVGIPTGSRYGFVFGMVLALNCNVAETRATSKSDCREATRSGKVLRPTPR